MCACAAVASKPFEILSHSWDTLNLQLGDWRCGHFRDHFIRKCLCWVLRHPSLTKYCKHLARFWNLDLRFGKMSVFLRRWSRSCVSSSLSSWSLTNSMQQAEQPFFWGGFCLQCTEINPRVQNMSCYPASVGVGAVSRCPTSRSSSFALCLIHPPCRSRRSRHWPTNHAFCTCFEQCKVIILLFQICFRSIVWAWSAVEDFPQFTSARSRYIVWVVWHPACCSDVFRLESL